METSSPSSGMTSEALVNQVTSLLARLEVSLIRQSDVLNGYGRAFDTYRAAQIERGAELRDHIDSRFDAYGGELDKVVALVGGSATEIKKLGNDVAALHDTQGAMALALSAEIERSERIEQDLQGLRTASLAFETTKRTWMATMDVWRATIEKEIAALSEQTIAHEISADERRTLTAINRWLHRHATAIAAALNLPPPDLP